MCAIHIVYEFERDKHIVASCDLVLYTQKIKKMRFYILQL